MEGPSTLEELRPVLGRRPLRCLDFSKGGLSNLSWSGDKIRLSERFLIYDIWHGRLFKFPQMDFEMAIWEMTSLLIAPKKVFRSIYYHVMTPPAVCFFSADGLLLETYEIFDSQFYVFLLRSLTTDSRNEKNMAPT